MSDTVAQLVTAVQSEGGFDVTNQAVEWLTRRQREMCARSRCYRQTATAGSTVEGQSVYPLPEDLVEALELRLDGQIYPPGRHSDIANGAKGYLWLEGPGGLAVSDTQAAGRVSVQFFPQPGDGLPIEVFGSFLPPDLAVGDESTLVIPQEFTDALISGACATGLMRLEGRADEARPHLEIFNAACTELRRRSARALRGPRRVRVLGYNAP